MAGSMAILTVAVIDRNHGRADIEFIMAYLVIAFGIKASICQETIDGNMLNGLTYRIRQQRTVVAGPDTYTGPGNQMTVVIGDYRQFCPFSVVMGTFALPHQKMAADKP